MYNYKALQGWDFLGIISMRYYGQDSVEVKTKCRVFVKNMGGKNFYKALYDDTCYAIEIGSFPFRADIYHYKIIMDDKECYIGDFCQ